MKSKLVKGLMVLGAVAVSGLLLSGCNCLPCDAKDAPAPKPKPAAKAMVSGTCPVVTQQDWGLAWVSWDVRGTAAHHAIPPRGECPAPCRVVAKQHRQSGETGA